MRTEGIEGCGRWAARHIGLWRLGPKWPRYLWRLVSRRVLLCLLALAILCICAVELTAVRLRRTIITDCALGFGIEMEAATGDPDAWGHESYLGFLRRRLRQEFADVTPVRSIRIEGEKHPIAQLTPVSLFPELRELEMNWTAVTDLSPLRHCRNLTKLECAHTGVRDFSHLSELRHLRQLNLADTAIADLTPLSSLHELQTLNLDGTKISCISPLAALNQLYDLSLNAVNGIDWRSLGQLRGLRKLSLAQSQIRDVSGLKSLKELKSLNLRNTSVTDLSVLEGLQRIELLDVRAIKIADFSIFQRLPALRELHVDIPADLSPPVAELSELKQLRALDLGVVAPLEWEALKPLTGLRQLTLRGPIERIRGIEVLQGLELLDLVETNVTQIQEIKTLESLPKLQTVRLRRDVPLVDYSKGRLTGTSGKIISYQQSATKWDPIRQRCFCELVLNRRPINQGEAAPTTTPEGRAEEPAAVDTRNDGEGSR